MKKCDYCGGENADTARRCGGCGTDFVVPEDNPVVEAAEPEADEPLDETVTLCAPIVENPQSANRLPLEYTLTVVVAISAGGYFYVVTLVLVLYLLLKRMRPRTDWELLMIASGYTGLNIIGSLHILSSGESPFFLLEPVLVSCAALAVLFTQRRGWALFLFVYSIAGALICLLTALLYIHKGVRPDYPVLRAAFFGSGTWLLKRWLYDHRRVQVAKLLKKKSDGPVMPEAETQSVK